VFVERTTENVHQRFFHMSVDEPAGQRVCATGATTGASNLVCEAIVPAALSKSQRVFGCGT